MAAEDLILNAQGKNKVQAAEHKPFQGTGPKTETPPAPADNSNSIFIDRNKFVIQEGSGLETNGRGRLTGEIRNKKVELDEAIQNQYVTFLDNHLQILSRIQQNNPNILKSPKRQQEAALLQHLVDSDGKPDEAKIKNFLGENPAGWILTTQLMEEQILLKSAGLGLDVARIPEAQRQNQANSTTVDLDNPMGKIVDKARNWWTKVNEDPISLSMAENVAAFKAIKADPNDAAYLKEFGIDIKDLEVYTTSTNPPKEALRLDPKRKFYETIDPTAKQQEIFSMLHTREEFYDRLGIKGKKLDAIPEQFLTLSASNRSRLDRKSSQQPEQALTWWHKRVQDVLNPNDPANPLANLSPEAQIQRYMDARRTVMGEMISGYIKDVRSRPTEGADKAIETIKAKKTSRESGPALQAKREAVDKQKQMLDSQTTTLSADREQLKNQQEETQQTRRELDQAYAQLAERKFKDLTALQTRVDELNKALFDINDPNSIAAKRAKDRENLIRAQIDELKKIPASTKKEVKQYLEDQINIQFQSSIGYVDAFYNNEAAPYTQELNALNAIQTQITTADQRLTTETDVTKQANQIFQSLDHELKTVTGWGVTESDLRTLSVDDLLNKINSVNTPATPTLGWPSGENDNPERRSQLYHAIVEAKALEQINNIPNFTNLEANRVKLTTSPWGLNDIQLRTLTSSEITDILAYNAGGITPPTLAEVNDAKEAARIHFDKRLEVYESEILSVSREAANQAEQAKKISESLAPEIRKLDVTLELIDARERLNTNTDDIIDRADAFTDITKATRKDQTVTDTERAAGPNGYLEFMEYMFQYKEREDRVEYFKKVSEVLPPKRLAELLNTSLELGLTKPDITGVLNTIKTDIGDGSIGRQEFVIAFRDIVNTYRKEALAM